MVVHTILTPPLRISFSNSPLCARFHDFVTRTNLQRVSNGSLLVWGEVGKVDPPHLAVPITIGPGKPWMFDSLINRFVTALSNWTAKWICLTTLLQVISRLPSMIRVVMTMFVCTRPVPLFWGCNGEDGFLFTLPFLLARKRAPSCTRRLVWRLLCAFVWSSVCALYR